MSINAVSAAIYSNLYYNSSLDSKLPIWMIERLEALGVDPSLVQGVAEARQIIQYIENNGGQFDNNSNFDSNNPNNPSCSLMVSGNIPSVSSCSGDSSLLQRIKTLAHKVGVSINENDEIEKMIETIQKAIDDLFIFAADKNDKNFYWTVCDFQNELNQIIIDAHIMTEKPKSPDKYLELLSKYNQAAIEINKREGKQY